MKLFAFIGVYLRFHRSPYSLALSMSLAVAFSYHRSGGSLTRGYWNFFFASFAHGW